MTALSDVFQEFARYGSWMCECFRTDCTEMTVRLRLVGGCRDLERGLAAWLQ